MQLKEDLIYTEHSHISLYMKSLCRKIRVTCARVGDQHNTVNTAGMATKLRSKDCFMNLATPLRDEIGARPSYLL